METSAERKSFSVIFAEWRTCRIRESTLNVLRTINEDPRGKWWKKFGPDSALSAKRSIWKVSRSWNTAGRDHRKSGMWNIGGEPNRELGRLVSSEQKTFGGRPFVLNWSGSNASYCDRYKLSRYIPAANYERLLVQLSRWFARFMVYHRARV